MPMMLENGVLVRLKGLKNVELNGKWGVIESRHDGADSRPALVKSGQEAAHEPRWVVRLVGEETAPKAIRQSNLFTARSGPAWMMPALFISAAATVAAGAVTHTAGPGTFLCALAPICSLVWYMATVALCYWLHAPLLEDGVAVPAISEMGVAKPAQHVYRLGFGLCGLMLMVTVLQFQRLVLAQIEVLSSPSEGEEASPPPYAGIGWGIAAAGGVALQGICVLNIQVGAEALVHLGAAMFAMFGTVQHAAASNAWFSALPSNSTLLRDDIVGYGLWLRRDAFKRAAESGVLLLLFAVPLVMQFMSRTGQGTGGKTVENCMGLMQWAIVAGIAMFFFSYILDLTA